MGRRACAQVAVCEDLQACFSSAEPSQSYIVTPSHVQSFAFFCVKLLKFLVDPFLQALWESCPRAYCLVVTSPQIWWHLPTWVCSPLPAPDHWWSRETRGPTRKLYGALLAWYLLTCRWSAAHWPQCSEPPVVKAMWGFLPFYMSFQPGMMFFPAVVGCKWLYQPNPAFGHTHKTFGSSVS